MDSSGGRKGKPRALRIHQSLARNVGRAILSGELAPGHVFGPELEQAPAYGVSSTAYREAIRILVAKNLVESRPKAGTRVTERRQWNKLDPDILEWMFEGRPDKTLVRDLFELRGLIEPQAAALAAQRFRPEHLEAMDKGLAGMRQHGLMSAAGQLADRDFHAAILAASGNEMLESLSSSIGAAVHWTTQFKQREGKIARDSVPEHIALRDAIASRNPGKARKAMQHLIDLSHIDMGEWA